MKRAILSVLVSVLAVVAPADGAFDSYLWSGAQTATAFAQYGYENGLLREYTNRADQVVEPVGLFKRDSAQTNAYRLVRRPTGMDIARWVLLVRSEDTKGVRPANNVGDEYPAKEYYGESIAIPGGNAQAKFEHWDKYLFVIPCFSWLTYDLVYDRNDGLGVSWRDAVSKHGATNEVTLAACPDGWRRAGYDFTGWSASPDGPTVFAASNVVTGIELGVVTNGPFRLYAQWRLRDLEVRLRFCDGATADGRLVVHVGEKWLLPTPERKYHAFAGWFTDEAGGEQIFDGDTVADETVTDLFARWTALPVCTVAFDWRDAHGAATNLKQVVVRGTDAEPPAKSVCDVWPGHRFVQWSAGFTNVTTNLSVSAVYAVYRHKVTFDANGGAAKWPTRTSSTARPSRWRRMPSSAPATRSSAGRPGRTPKSPRMRTARPSGTFPGKTARLLRSTPSGTACQAQSRLTRTAARARWCRSSAWRATW